MGFVSMDAKKLKSSSTDRISSLPDELLGTILSSLPTKQAVSTSILSRKWRNVFRLVHNLNIDYSVLVSEGQFQYGFPEGSEIFVDQTLTLHPIKKFSLNCHLGLCKKTCVNRLISNALKRGVLELDLRIKVMGEQHVLPPQLFASKTLLKLTLGKNFSPGKLPSFVLLPSLKTLFIETVFFEYEDFCGVLLAGCPLLEELSVCHGLQIIGPPKTISHPTVKRLSVKYDSPYNSVNSFMSFNLPKLVYLEYSHSPLAKYPQVNFESLIEAKLDLHLVKEKNWRSNVTNLLLGIRNVEILHLSPDSVDVICSRCRYELLIFINLVKLYFGSKKKQSWKLLAYLLKKSPKLETLIIKDLNSEINDDVFMHLNKVKVLRISSYEGSARELKHLKSFLGKTKSLKVVQVDVTTEKKDDSMITETNRQLMMHLGVSLPSNCKIKVSHKLVI